ncbi:unnamed protein product [Trichogramma brassicae]|uniref:Uncharacterized protein n=1 Tax=Trichogramma brassicae TaxID=86971 RepID=A0A6H5HYU2_9HYME|nr:unnamed protein product [Trichogramma brassicae]
MPMKHEAMSRSEALEIISNWSCSDVLLLLKKGNYIDFVARTGYRDEPDVDKDGNLLLHRTTPLHRAVKRKDFFAHSLFIVYNRYEANYTDEFEWRGGGLLQGGRETPDRRGRAAREYTRILLHISFIYTKIRDRNLRAQHLTEGKLALWKTDLARPHIWDLWTFVEEVKKNPEVYAQGAEQPQADSSIGSEETRAESRASSSDNISWDAEQVITSTPKSQTNSTGRDDDASPDFRSSLRMFQENDRRSMRADPLRSSNASLNRRSQDKSLEESPPDGSATYANISATVVNDQTTYANLPFANDQTTTTTTKHDVEQAQEETLKNSSRLHKSGLTKSLADQLREQLEIRANRSPNKPSPVQRPDNTTDKPRESFLHCAKSNGTTGTSHTLPYFHRNRRSPVSGVASLDTSSRASQGSTSGSDGGGGGGGSDQAQQLRNLPKPPPSMTLRDLDLVANLPRRPTVGSDSDADAEDEEDDGEGYEAFDEQIVERHQQQRGSIVSVDSFASVRDDHGLPQQQQQQQPPPPQQPPQQPPPPPPPDGGGLDDEEVYEIYESITESPDDENGREYINADFKVRPDPPPLPAKPPPNLTANLNNKNKTEAKSGSLTSIILILRIM